MIKRKLIYKLKKWRVDRNRKPLLLQGARQVGKTWLLKHFGKEEFEDMAYFNFEEQPELQQFFTQSKEINRIVQHLSLVHGREIRPQHTFIVFDEIQECNAALNSLKYFCENAPEYAVAGAGSLLGVALSQGQGFPVGKVQFMKVGPADFSEFLNLTDLKLSEYLDSIEQIAPLPDIFFNPLIDKLKMYYLCGGMPEAVTTLVEEGVDKTEQVLQDILDAYVLDFSKHADKNTIPRINHIWQSIPSQLAKENKKFIYKKVRSGARAREYEDALLWLSQAGCIYRIFKNNKPALPLSAYDDLLAFKTYLVDVGLLRRLSRLSATAVKEKNRLFTEFKGALTENFVLQHLLADTEEMPRYWTSGNKAEVDFLLQRDNEIIPVEVKADENIKSRSLTVYHQKYHPNLRIRYSLRNLNYKDGLLNIPLFMAGFTRKLIGLVGEGKMS